MSLQRAEWHQRTFELNFAVDNLRAAIAKSNGDGGEKPLGDVVLERFELGFWLARFDMHVNVNLRYEIPSESNVAADGAFKIPFYESRPAWGGPNKVYVFRQLRCPG